MALKGVVFDAQESNGGKEWLTVFQKQLGTNWQGLSPMDTSSRLCKLLMTNHGNVGMMRSAGTYCR